VNAVKKQSGLQRGFSLLEMMMVVLLLSVVVGATFSQINKAQTRYQAEGQKLDLTQQEREFVDQFTRDLHQAGYPTAASYGNNFDVSSPRVAAGLWYISPTDVKMEGDIDGDGTIESVIYHYNDGSTWAGPGTNPCPCLQRSSVPKSAVNAWPWNQAAPQYYTQVQNVIPVGATAAFFQAYDANGNIVSLAAPIQLGSGGAVDANAQKALQTIKGVRLTFTVQGQVNDSDIHKSIQVTMTGMARLPNN
jgi:prepilin-type N-terminal cleavage/methylation domain-containing protein